MADVKNRRGICVTHQAALAGPGDLPALLEQVPARQRLVDRPASGPGGRRAAGGGPAAAVPADAVHGARGGAGLAGVRLPRSGLPQVPPGPAAGDVRVPAGVPLDRWCAGQREVVFPGGHDLAAPRRAAPLVRRPLRRRRHADEPSAAGVRVAAIPEPQPAGFGGDRQDRDAGRPVRHGALRRPSRELPAAVHLLAGPVGRARELPLGRHARPGRCAFTTTRASISCRARMRPPAR